MTSWTMSASWRDCAGVRTSCWVMRTRGMSGSLGGCGAGGRCAGSSGSGAGMRRRRWSGARGVGGGEQGAGAAFEALDLAEGGVLVLDVDVQVRVRRSERREETGPVLHVVPLAERHEAPGRVLRPGGAGVPDPGGGAPRGVLGDGPEVGVEHAAHGRTREHGGVLGVDVRDVPAEPLDAGDGVHLLPEPDRKSVV